MIEAALMCRYHAKQLYDDALLYKLLSKLLGSETSESLKDTVEIRDIIKATFIGYIGNRVSGFIYKQSRHGTHSYLIETVDKVAACAYLDKAAERRGTHIDQTCHIGECYTFGIVLMQILHNEFHTARIIDLRTFGEHLVRQLLRPLI